MIEAVTVAQVPTALLAPAEMVEAQSRLLSRFNPDRPPQPSLLQAVIDNEKSALIFALLSFSAGHLLAWDAIPKESYVGTLTLSGLVTTTRYTGYIEHVAVDENYEGQGIGEMLVRRAIIVARAKGASRLDLTSGDSKEAAQRLYEKTGFTRRSTNNWRYELD